MQLRSFMRQGFELLPVEVELSLMPGLPQIHFLGLPDQAMRESSLRIRSALRRQGFKLPRAQQIVVQLRPLHGRKSSQGLDLAVATGILWITKQIPSLAGKPVIYGALSLAGDIEAPSDACEIELSSNEVLLTGPGPELGVPSRRLKSLRELRELENVSIQASSACRSTQLEFKIKKVSAKAARLAAVVAAGNHSALIAGPPGSGKTTLTEVIALLASRGERAIVRPHHTITPCAMIGGGQGARLWPGEIHRADGGILLLDELLKFHPDIQAVLREPLDTGEVHVARIGGRRVYPTQFQMLATTNFCDCGQFIPRPGAGIVCRCSRSRRRKTVDRLSGPFADRFAVIDFSDTWEIEAARHSRAADDDLIRPRPEFFVPGRETGMVAVRSLLNTVAGAVSFRVENRGQLAANAWAPLEVIEESIDPELRLAQFLPSSSGMSYRRHEAALRVARTSADLDFAKLIGKAHLAEGVRLCFENHALLENWRE